MPHIEALLDAEVRLVAITGQPTCGGQSMLSFVRPMKEPPSVDLWRDQVLSAAIEEDEAGLEEDEPEGLVDWLRKDMVRLVVDKHVEAPKIYTLSLHLPATPREIAGQLEGVRVVSATCNFIVLSTGPKFYDYPSSGHCLVYDVDADALVLAPPVDWNEFREIIGCAPVVIMPDQCGCDFILARLLTSSRNGKPCLWLWHSSTSTSIGQEGSVNVNMDISLPSQVVDYGFVTDKAFAFLNLACWVDLNLGILICNVLSTNPRFELVPLPKECQMLSLPMERGRPDVYSTVGCVNGEIKLIYIDGYVDKDKFSRDKITITTWTLTGTNHFVDLHRWAWIKDDMASPLAIADIWADQSFVAIPKLPKRPPMCPVLSPMQPDLIYFFLSDIVYVDGSVATKGEHVLGLDIENKKVQSWSKCPPGRSFQLFPSFIPTISSSATRQLSYPDDQITSQLLLPVTSFIC